MKLAFILAITFLVSSFPAVHGRLFKRANTRHKGGKDKRRTTDEKVLFRIVQGSYESPNDDKQCDEDIPIVLAPVVHDAHNVGFWIHCHNYPDCLHPIWYWGDKPTFRKHFVSYYYEKELGYN